MVMNGVMRGLYQAFQPRRIRIAWAFAALLILLSLVLPARVRAQTSTLRFDRLSIEDGLSQSKINSIFQDQRGFMWFGTVEGLNKYDGYTFTVYTLDPDNPLRSRIRHLKRDKPSRITFHVSHRDALHFPIP